MNETRDVKRQAAMKRAMERYRERTRELVASGAGPAPVRVVVTKSRKGYQWAQIARNGSAGAISPKTYDTKSNAVRAARRQAALVGGVVEVQ